MRKQPMAVATQVPSRGLSQSNFFIPNLPFTKKWMAALDKAYDEGGWHCLSAGAQQGKSTANRAFLLAHPPVKFEQGGLHVPVAITTACPRRKLLLTDLADSLGAKALVRPRVDLIEVIAVALERGRTRLIIINNAHDMDWRQWQWLFALHEVYFRRSGIAPGIVFSSIGSNVALADVPSNDEAIDQLRKRMFYTAIEGHTRKDLKTALELFLNARAPKVLAGTDILEVSALLYDELTTELFDPHRSKRVAALDIDEIVTRVGVLYAAGERSGEQLILKAIADYRLGRTPSTVAA